MIINMSMCRFTVCSSHVYMYEFLVWGVVCVLSASTDASSAHLMLT
jgi:hypothetical protein